MTLARMTVIDLETTGLAPPGSVVEIGWTCLEFDTVTKQSAISSPVSRLFRPADAMAPDNIAVHHLTPEMLAPYDLCTDADLQAVATSCSPMFLVAAHAAFEQQWLTPEVTERNHWICTVKAAARLYPDAPSHSNQAMRYQLGLDLPEELAMPPHRAGPDSYVTAHILAEFLKTTSVGDLVLWTMEPRYLPRIPFGKYKGSAWSEAPADYLRWMIGQADMDSDAKHAAQLEIDRRRAPQ